jgi:heat shock protein HslJ
MSRGNNGKASQGRLAGTSWNLTTIFDGNDRLDAASEAAVLELREDGTLGGSTGCNSFSGDWMQAGPELTLELGPMTLRACLDPVTDRQEQLVLAMLPAVRTFDVDGGVLTLRDAAGIPVLAYEQGLRDLAGTRWRATAVNNGRGGLEANEHTGNVWIAFAADDTMTGSGGCNRFSGRYRSDGETFTTTSMVSTRLLCDPGVMELEQQLFDALAHVRTYHVFGRQLSLRDADGAMQATFVLAPGAGMRPYV